MILVRQISYFISLYSLLSAVVLGQDGIYVNGEFVQRNPIVLDKSFGIGGRVRLSMSKPTSDSDVFDIVNHMTLGEDGSILLVGNRRNNTYDYNRFALWRFNEKGQAVDSFGVQGRSELSFGPRCAPDIRVDGDPNKTTWVSLVATSGTYCSVSGAQVYQITANGSALVTDSYIGFAQNYPNAVGLLTLKDGGALVAAYQGFSEAPGIRIQGVNQNGSINLNFAQQGNLLIPMTLIPTTISKAQEVLLTQLRDGQIVIGYVNNSDNTLNLGRFKLNEADAKKVIWKKIDLTHELGETKLQVHRLRPSANGTVWALLKGKTYDFLVTQNMEDTSQTTTVRNISFVTSDIDQVSSTHGASVFLVGNIATFERTRYLAIAQWVEKTEALPFLNYQELQATDGGIINKPKAVRARVKDNKVEITLVAEDSTGTYIERYLMTEATPSPDGVVVEFHNTLLDHYFITANQAERAAILKGSAGPGWRETGKYFRSFSYPKTNLIGQGTKPTCRFYGNVPVGPNSHFYTNNEAECSKVKIDSGWGYEGISFYIYGVLGETCAENQLPVYRAYNNGFVRNDSNHRYFTDPSIGAEMKAKGWHLEEMVFCAPQ